MEPIYFTMDELMQEFNKKVITKAKPFAMDANRLIDLITHERFNPEHFSLFAGFVRGMRRANDSNQ